MASFDRLFAPVTGPDLIDREEIVERLLQNFRDIDRPWAQQYALIGSRRIGKTSIIREVHRRMKADPWADMPIPVWLDIARIAEVAQYDYDRFAEKYLAAFVHDYAAHELPDLSLPRWEDLELLDLQQLAEQLGDEIVLRKIKLLHSPDFSSKAFSATLAPAEIVEKYGKRFAFIVDEVQDLATVPHGMTLLINYREAFESIFCLHIFTGSAVSIMSSDVFGYSSPLHGRVTQIHLDPLTPPYDFQLMDKIGQEYGLTWDEEAQILLNALTGGHPFSTTCVTAQLLQRGVTHATPEKVEEAFQEELLRGRLHQEFLDRTDPHLRALGEVEVAVALLERIVHREEDTVHVLDLKTVPGYDVAVLNNLARSDVIRLNGGGARLVDPAYKTWLRDVYLPLVWRLQAEEYAMDRLQATVKRLANDVGRLFEITVRDVMWYFGEQTVEGTLFGRPGETLTLPSFERVSTRVRYAGPELPEEFEIDVYGDCRSDQDTDRWFVECKYWEEPVTEEVLRDLLHKRELFNGQFYPARIVLWLCTKHPLPEALRGLAREQGLYFSSEADLHALFDVVRQGSG